MGGGRSTSSERGRRDIADIMVVPAKAPGPFAADVENGELLAQQKLADRLVRLFGRTPHHHGRVNAPPCLGLYIVRCENLPGERQIVDIGAEGVNARIKGYRRAFQPEAIASRRPRRSEERRGGKEGVRTCRSRWAPDH